MWTSARGRWVLIIDEQDFPPLGEKVLCLIDEDLPPNYDQDKEPWLALLSLHRDNDPNLRPEGVLFWKMEDPTEDQDEILTQNYTVVAWRPYVESDSVAGPDGWSGSS